MTECINYLSEGQGAFHVQWLASWWWVGLVGMDECSMVLSLQADRF
jgi:hypothetical protein